MNLWVKRTGQLLLAALFLMACEDESSLLGFKNPIGKFDVKYIEIPVASSVFFIDSIRTSNLAGETNRLLIGEHHDQNFGTIKTTGYSHLLPSSFTTVDASAQVDSVVLHLRFDFYQYGLADVSNQSFSIHELTARMYNDSIFNYFSKSTVSYDPSPIGSSSYLVNPEYFKSQFQKANNAKDTVILKITLNNSFGLKLMERAKAGDTTYTRFSEFTKYIKGLAIVPTANTKVIGFDLNNTITAGSRFSKVVVHYHTATEDSLALDFAFGGVQFTRIETDRSGSELNQVNNFYEEFSPSNNLRYAQAGTGVVTKLDFSNYISFYENNPFMIVNSAELVIRGLQSVDSYDPVNSFTLQVLNQNNRFKKVRFKREIDRVINNDTIWKTVIDPIDANVLALYRGTVTNASDGFLTAINDVNTVFTLSKSTTANTFSGHMTLLSQKLYDLDRINKDPFRYFALFPNNPQNGKSLNRIIFHKDDIVLRVYYTLPTVNE